jgi:hypothetical protein
MKYKKGFLILFINVPKRFSIPIVELQFQSKDGMDCVGGAFRTATIRRRLSFPLVAPPKIISAKTAFIFVGSVQKMQTVVISSYCLQISTIVKQREARVFIVSAKLFFRLVTIARNRSFWMIDLPAEA